MEEMLLPLTTYQWILELAMSLLLVSLGQTVRKRVKEKTDWDTVKAWIGILTGTGSATFISLILLYRLLT